MWLVRFLPILPHLEGVKPGKDGTKREDTETRHIPEAKQEVMWIDIFITSGMERGEGGVGGEGLAKHGKSKGCKTRKEAV